MKAVAQIEIITLISDINAFVDTAETLINVTQTTYDRDKENLQFRHNNALNSLESSYRDNCTAIRNKSQKTISDAKRILSEITKLDEKLSSADKYYVKTKKKKEELWSDKTSSEYDNAVDYFTALIEIQDSFNVLFKKYSEDILPGLINGLNYFFSSKRKRDYEELIVLRNTVTAFVQEIEKELPPIIDENLSSLKEDYLTQRGGLTERHSNEMDAFENKYLNTLDEVAEKIYAELDNILPDEFVDYLYALITHYDSIIFKVNSTDEVLDGVLNMMFIDYKVDFFVQSKIIASVIREKCDKLLVDGVIRFPIALSLSDASVWMVISDNSNQTTVQSFTHSIMFGLLSAMPIEKLTYGIVDPENRGNSISPYFDVMKVLPELFGEKIYINRDDVAIKIAKLNEYIEGVLQEKLGNQYDTIFDYAIDHDEYSVQVELLVLYDFPKGFDERTLAELRSIIRNGNRCGIYTIITYQPKIEGMWSAEFEQNIKAIYDLSTGITQNGQNFILRGLPLSYFAMPEKADFVKFVNKYMLIFEGIKNRGIAFSPLIKKLVDECDPMELDSHISYICSMMDSYEKNYAQVQEIGASFPSIITLGNVMYPADIFSDSIDYHQILEKFGLGSFKEDETGYVELPLTFDLKNSFNLFLNCPENSKEKMLVYSHHVIWSFLSLMPVSKVDICLFDVEQRGNSIIPFLDFRKRCPDVFDQKIYTNQEAMYERLQKVNIQIDEFIQDKLGNRYRDILDYNLNTPNRAEAITLLVLYDFPSGMDGRSLDLLSNILRNGNKCGVYVVICYNPGITFSKYESIDERLEGITRYCALVDYKDENYVLLPYNLRVKIPEKLDNRDIDRFTFDYVEKSEIIKKQGLSFKDILAEDLFAYNSAKALTIPVGVGDGDLIINITIGEGSSHHGLIAGATGSGKSTFLHTLIMSSMLHYSPEQLHLYLMDFKSGTEFKVYESVKLPHIQLLALDAMQEFGESILENLVKEMEKRGVLFKESGKTSLKGYTQAIGKPLPRILVIMDEFQILFNDSTNRKVAMNCAELTKRIVTEGRAFGIHLLMATQSTKVISDLTLSHGTIEQMRIRVGLKCGENDARYLFSDQNEIKAMSMMKGPIGTAVMNLDYTELPNVGFRAAYCDDDTQKYYLQLISAKFNDKPYTLQTFEGGRTVELFDYYRNAGIGYTEELPVIIHLGTLIKVAPPFVLCIDKKKKHNLLVCGSNERMANLVSNNYIISALLNKNTSVYCIDGDRLVGDNTSEGFYDALTEASSRFKVAEDRGDIIKYIRDIYKKYQAWKKQNSDDVIFLIIKNLQFLDIVRTMFKGEMLDESDYIEDDSIVIEENTSADPFAAINNMFAAKCNDDNLSTGEKLVKLIEDGSGFGIHFVVTSLEYQTVRETMYYGENLLTKFPERIIFSLGANDADCLIENISVPGLRDNTVYYTDGIKNTFQMKPYILPSTSEIKLYMENKL